MPGCSRLLLTYATNLSPEGKAHMRDGAARLAVIARRAVTTAALLRRLLRPGGSPRAQHAERPSRERDGRSVRRRR